MKADVLVLFGATGDLAKKKLFPALYDMEDLGQLDIPVVGVASSKWTQEVFRDNVEAAVRARKNNADERIITKLREEVQLIVGDYNNPETSLNLRKQSKITNFPSSTSQSLQSSLRRLPNRLQQLESPSALALL
jgi:glucose-6-phosphate 1-dehydrogenase